MRPKDNLFIKNLINLGLVSPTQRTLEERRKEKDGIVWLSYCGIWIYSHAQPLWTTWNKTLEAGKETLAVALDISKAFDKVWHKNLLVK